VFRLGVESRFESCVKFREQALTTCLGNIYSDSKVGLLLQLQITDSYVLNVAPEEIIVQYDQLDGIGWAKGDLHTIVGFRKDGVGMFI
jgi:hypothetical protein